MIHTFSKGNSNCKKIEHKKIKLIFIKVMRYKECILYGFLVVHKDYMVQSYTMSTNGAYQTVFKNYFNFVCSVKKDIITINIRNVKCS